MHCVKVDYGSLDERNLKIVMGACGDIRKMELESGLVYFQEASAAEIAIHLFNQRRILGELLRISHYQSEELYYVFVGDLSPDIDDQQLKKAFSKYGSCYDSRVMWDNASGKSRGYGFVSFTDKDDAERSIVHMNGAILGKRPIRCNWASNKTKKMLPTVNSTVYVGNLSECFSMAHLVQRFAQFGVIQDAKSHSGFAFLTFSNPDEAYAAIEQMNGEKFDNRSLKCGWGKSP